VAKNHKNGEIGVKSYLKAGPIRTDWLVCLILRGSIDVNDNYSISGGWLKVTLAMTHDMTHGMGDCV